MPGSSGTTTPDTRTRWTTPPELAEASAGVPGLSSSGHTVPEGRLLLPDGWTASPKVSTESELSLTTDVVPFSDWWVSARVPRKARGDRTAWAILPVDGRSGNDPRTSVSRRSRNLRKSPQSPPICLATLGNLSGPSTTRATTRMINNLAGLRNGTLSSLPATTTGGAALPLPGPGEAAGSGVRGP